mmetsp:Transcript_11768/g.36773  ORF Transcript_11768/g.36773 Transcript_11768/m.36773 type:complete len:354 (-) Transcript_11768:83-1144(-)
MAKTIILKSNLDEGIPGPEHFEIVTTPMPTISDGLLLELHTISADPYMRGRIRSGGDFKAGKPMAGFVSGKVLESKVPEWKAGDLFGASLPFTTVQAVSAAHLKAQPFRKLTGLVTEEDISLGIGVLGMPGSTAYGGFTDVLKPKTGETLWVSGAAGAVGSMVGMIAKNVYGCKVLGSAGGPEKCKMVTERFGFDHCVDYKTCGRTRDLVAAVLKVAPGGIDMYFENVGGMHFEAALTCLRPKGRVAVCGAIAGYNDALPTPNKIHITNLIYTFQRIEGFVCTPWLTGEKGKFLTDMAGWVKEGKVKVEETFFSGVESFGTAFKSLFVGSNTGKVVVRCGPMQSGGTNPTAKL